MEFVPLSPALGVEVRGVDLREPLGDDDVARLRGAFDAHHLLLVRGQDIDQATQERFVGVFGSPIDAFGNGETSRLLSNVLTNGGNGELPFHSDMAFLASPTEVSTRLPKRTGDAIAFYALEIPAAGTETWFANAVSAWADLPDDLCDRATGLVACHGKYFSQTDNEESRTRHHALPTSAPRLRDRLPLVHPRTAASVLYVNDLHIERLEGLDGAESDALIEALLAHLYQDRHVYEHRWQLHDLAVWDNLALQHARRDVSTVGARTFRRTTIDTRFRADVAPAVPSGG